MIPHSHTNLVVNKGVKNKHWRKDSFFCWRNGYLPAENWN
jgi:hypothetical protein